jgi:hypothetical protein
VLTSLTLALSWLTAPVPTLTFLRLSSEVRKAAALAHNAASDEADTDAAADDAVALGAVLAAELELELELELHPAVSSARQHTRVASFHRVTRLRRCGFISRQANVRRHARTSPSGGYFRLSPGGRI